MEKLPYCERTGECSVECAHFSMKKTGSVVIGTYCAYNETGKEEPKEETPCDDGGGCDTGCPYRRECAYDVQMRVLVCDYLNISMVRPREIQGCMAERAQGVVIAGK